MFTKIAIAGVALLLLAPTALALQMTPVEKVDSPAISTPSDPKDADVSDVEAPARCENHSTYNESTPSGSVDRQKSDCTGMNDAGCVGFWGYESEQHYDHNGEPTGPPKANRYDNTICT